MGPAQYRFNYVTLICSLLPKGLYFSKSFLSFGEKFEESLFLLQTLKFFTRSARFGALPPINFLLPTAFIHISASSYMACRTSSLILCLGKETFLIILRVNKKIHIFFFRKPEALICISFGVNCLLNNQELL